MKDKLIGLETGWAVSTTSTPPPFNDAFTAYDRWRKASRTYEVWGMCIQIRHDMIQTFQFGIPMSAAWVAQDLHELPEGR
ncbi:hypothetical protein [Nocardia nova]|uniref:hypothetical protein n=1 Tax=Nocardia nova TaxID=37330 RepID=UPI0027388E3C|nr:hypothetical protein [Nocardia nova]